MNDSKRMSDLISAVEPEETDMEYVLQHTVILESSDGSVALDAEDTFVSFQDIDTAQRYRRMMGEEGWGFVPVKLTQGDWIDLCAEMLAGGVQYLSLPGFDSLGYLTRVTALAPLVTEFRLASDGAHKHSGTSRRD